MSAFYNMKVGMGLVVSSLNFLDCCAYDTVMNEQQIKEVKKHFEPSRASMKVKPDFRESKSMKVKVEENGIDVVKEYEWTTLRMPLLKSRTTCVGQNAQYETLRKNAKHIKQLREDLFTLDGANFGQKKAFSADEWAQKQFGFSRQDKNTRATLEEQEHHMQWQEDKGDATDAPLRITLANGKLVMKYTNQDNEETSIVVKKRRDVMTIHSTVWQLLDEKTINSIYLDKTASKCWAELKVVRDNVKMMQQCQKLKCPDLDRTGRLMLYWTKLAFKTYNDHIEEENKKWELQEAMKQF